MKYRQWILAKHFEGFPKDDDMELVQEELPSLTDGGESLFAISTEWLVYLWNN